MSQNTTVFIFNDGAATPFVSRVTTNTATTILDATTGQQNMVSMYVTENAGSTPNLTVELFDTVNSISYLLPDTSKIVWNASAVTARQTAEFGSFVIPLGFKLRVTSSDAAGKFNVIGIKVGRGRSAVGGG